MNNKTPAAGQPMRVVTFLVISNLFLILVVGVLSFILLITTLRADAEAADTALAEEVGAISDPASSLPTRAATASSPTATFVAVASPAAITESTTQLLPTATAAQITTVESVAQVAPPITAEQIAASQCEIMVPSTNGDDQSASGGDEIITKLPYPIVDTRIACGGQLILLRLQAFAGIAVYDVQARAIAQIIGLASTNFIYASGGSTLLVYYPETNLFESWDLLTYENRRTRPNAVGSTVAYVTMGHSDGQRALVRYAIGTDALDRTGSYLLDAVTLEPIPGDEEARENGRNISYRTNVQQRSDGALQYVSEWATGQSPTGLAVFLITDTTWTTRYEHTTAGYVAVGDDGFLYTGNGGIYNTQLTEIANVSGTYPIPAIGGGLFLGLSSNGMMQIYQSATESPIGPAGMFPIETDDNMQMRELSRLAQFDRHIIFSIVDDYIILIPPGGDELIHRPFVLEDALASAGVDYLLVTSAPQLSVTPGQTWEYSIETISSGSEVLFELEFGPQGMAIDANGNMSWAVPQQSVVVADVIVRITDDTGQVKYHNFTLKYP
ncbi:MAG: hypothetical protein KDE59_18670 [Anaerolineales bacterium]|nr:hypothetical protein [Anaerolineales bacterium]